MKKRVLALLLLAVLLMSTPAETGNLRSFPMADEAAMTGGAGVAVSRDSGSLWYNPAGLGGLTLGRMELTGTVYSLKIRVLDGLIETDLPSGTHERSISSNDIQSVPTALVFVRNINERLSIGFAMYQTMNSDIDYRLSLEVPYDDLGASWSEGVEYHQRASVYHLGPACGVALNPRLRIGFSLYLLFMNASAGFRGFAGIQDSDSDNASSSLASISSYGTVMKLGMNLGAGLQWEFVPHWHVGLVLRSPTFIFFESSDVSALDSDAFAMTKNSALYYDYVTDEKRAAGFTQVVPLEGQLALAYKKKGSWIGIEAAFRPPLEKEDFGFLWNASLGGRLQLSELFSWGAGVFTDRNSTKLSQTILDWQSDRYGFATGIEFKTPVLVQSISASDEGEELEGKEKDEASKLRKLVWATTLALSYSFEIATYNALYIDARKELILDIKQKTGVFHQPTIYLGTALYF